MLTQELAHIRAQWDGLAIEAGADLYAMLGKAAPRDASVPQNLALFLLLKGDFAGAARAIEGALAIRKDGLSYFIKGRAHDELFDLRRAIEAYRKCLSRDPGNAKAKFYLSLALLTLGDFAEGTRLYPHRLTPALRARIAGIKAWTPRERPGRVLIWAEQGIGDEVMFLQLLHLAARLDFAFTVEVDRRLVSVFEANFPAMMFIARGGAIAPGAFDYQIAFGDLLGHFHQPLRNGEVPRPAFAAVPRADVAARVAEVKRHRQLVGLSWLSASADHGLRRSVPIETMIRTLDPARHAIAVLQYLAQPEDIAKLTARGFTVIDEFDGFDDIEAAFALIAACDTILSIDNSVAHFAGALGIATHVLLPQIPNWRWGVSGTRSYWYPSLTLHRRAAGQSWDDVVGNILIPERQEKGPADRSASPIMCW